MATKAEIRRTMRERKRQYTADELRLLSQPIVERLLQHPAVTAANTILLYHSLPDEVHTHSLINTLLAAGKRILLPKVIDDSRMELREYIAGNGEIAEKRTANNDEIAEEYTTNNGEIAEEHTSSNALVVGSYGILEPCGAAWPASRYGEIDVAIVPGVAFDYGGRRLGRGKGYYDRLLPHLANARLLGLCFPFQIVPSVPADQHDMPMHEVLASGQ